MDAPSCVVLHDVSNVLMSRSNWSDGCVREWEIHLIDPLNAQRRGTLMPNAITQDTLTTLRAIYMYTYVRMRTFSVFFSFGE